MKQKTRFKNFENIGYWYRPMNGRYIGIDLKKSHIGRSLVQTHTIWAKQIDKNRQNRTINRKF